MYSDGLYCLDEKYALSLCCVCTAVKGQMKKECPFQDFLLRKASPGELKSLVSTAVSHPASALKAAKATKVVFKKILPFIGTDLP